MPQIGSPQKNLQDPLAADAASSFIDNGQPVKDEKAKDDSRPGATASDGLSKLAPQPDLPKANTKSDNYDAGGALTFPTVTRGGAFDPKKAAATRAKNANGLLENSVVLAQPRTTGFGAGYGAMSGGTPDGLVTAAVTLAFITYTAKMGGLSGNAVRIKYVDGGEAGAESVAVAGNDITVTFDDGESTATQVKTALDASVAAAALITTTIAGGHGGDAQSVATAATFQSLAGGAGLSSDGHGDPANGKGSFSAINRSGSRMHANLSVISRPGDNQGPQFLC